MTLKEQLDNDLKEAMRQRDGERSGVLRMIKAAIHNAEIDQRQELDDQAVLAVLSKAAKQRRESIEAYQQADRGDLIAVEQRELDIIKAYLPRQLEEEDIRKVAAQAIAELEAQGPQDMGRVMKHLMAQLRGQADGRQVNAIVRELLMG